MRETEYAYAVAYMKTFENKMLSHSELENMINADTTEEAKKIMLDKGCTDRGSLRETLDDILRREREELWTEAENCCGEEAPLEILLYKNDFHNLKTILKAVVCSTEWRKLVMEPCIANPEKIWEAVKNADFEALPEFMKKHAKRAYKIITTTGDGQLCEIYIDKATFEEMYKRTQKEKNEFLTGWVDLNILLANMKIVIRTIGKSNGFIEEALIKTGNGKYEKLLSLAQSLTTGAEIINELGYPDGAEALDKSFSEFEKWCDNKKMEYIKKAKLKCFGFEPILAILIAKEYEQQAVRIIFAGKENGLSKEIIKERLRDMYV